MISYQRIHFKLLLWICLCSTITISLIQILYEREIAALENGLPWGIDYHPYSPEKHITKVNNSIKLWPSVDKMETDDRIINQIHSYNKATDKIKTILIAGYGEDDDAKERFDYECPVKNCKFINEQDDENAFSYADAVLVYRYTNVFNKKPHPPKQIRILYLLESPVHTGDFSGTAAFSINWTASYRRDSVISTPYEKYVLNDHFSSLTEKAPQDYARNKTKLVAWFVSNCLSKNGRENYVAELRKYIKVDTYGHCGNFSCPRSINYECLDILKRDYKFYLAFENSNCRDYITEKTHRKSFRNNIVPVVMGAHPDDYKAATPPHSYIHVDNFESPKALAEYLLLLDKNPDLYNSYFRWKGQGEHINTKFWCRLCNMVHAAEDGPKLAYESIHNWWHGPNMCITPTKDKGWASWRDYNISENTETVYSSLKIL